MKFLFHYLWKNQVTQLEKQGVCVRIFQVDVFGWYLGQRGHSLSSRADVIPRYQSTLERDVRLTQPLLVFVSIKGKEKARKNDFLNPTSCGTVLHIHRGATGRSEVSRTLHLLTWTELALSLRKQTSWQSGCRSLFHIALCFHHFWPFFALTNSVPDLLAEKKYKLCSRLYADFVSSAQASKTDGAANKRKKCRCKELSICCLCVLVLGLILFLWDFWGMFFFSSFFTGGTITAQICDVWAIEQSPAHKPKSRQLYCCL